MKNAGLIIIAAGAALLLLSAKKGGAGTQSGAITSITLSQASMGAKSPGDPLALSVGWVPATKDYLGNLIPWNYRFLATIVNGIANGTPKEIILTNVSPNPAGLTQAIPGLAVPSLAQLQLNGPTISVKLILEAAKSDPLGRPLTGLNNWVPIGTGDSNTLSVGAAAVPSATITGVSVSQQAGYALSMAGYYGGRA